MSHRISIKRAKMLTEKENELKELQKQNKPLPTSRRQKKYEITRRRIAGRLWKIKDRIRATHGKMPAHLMERQN